MEKLIIRGGRPLHGKVRAGGRKNSAVAVLPAALLARGPCRVEGVPQILDVARYLDVLAAMGAEVARPAPATAVVAANGLDVSRVPYDLMKRLRASYYLLGVLLGRYGEAEVPLPGGCDIGQRPIDQHLKGLRALGAEVQILHGVIRARARRLRGARVYLDVTSVGATINIMLAAVLAEGTTIIENAAKEPHVVDLATFLNAMGARVVGAGTDVIKVHGTRELHGCEHALIPDEIEAATYMMAVAATGGDALVENVVPRHLEPISAKLREAGAWVEENGDSVRVAAASRLRAVAVKTLPYPGFPTDAQQAMTALLSLADGTSTVTETVWEARFKQVDELERMGTRIRVEGRTAVIQGVERLFGAPVQATDLRAGGALAVAGLAAEGVTEVSGLEHVDRGYERFDEKLASLGADVRRTRG
jgi:UDP-N-acetylglucosamine 1-carboxyvinyltransferase